MPVEDDTIVGELGAASEPPELASPIVAGRYRIVRWLGGGGMGSVYEATDEELGERVALKVLRGGVTEVALERFRREVKLTRRIVHRNVARMFDIGEHDGERFLTMELVDGEPLTSLLGRLVGWDQLRDIAVQLCSGLAAAHDAGVVHRDLKPDNILLERETARVVIADFGIASTRGDARVTQTGTVVGTPRYMAPEQLAGEPVDARADLFSLGVILYELASGTRPWQGTTPIDIAVAQATQPPEPLRADMPREAIGIIEACLAHGREGRPARAADVARAFAPHSVDSAAIAAEPVVRVSQREPVPWRDRSTVAVLPFRCAPPDQYLADWLHEDLIDILSTSSHLRLRAASATVVDDRLETRELGRRFAVDHVIEGSLRRVPSGLRVSARLVTVEDGFQVWARVGDYAEADVLGISDRLAREIADALSTRTPTVPQPNATDPHAIALYLRARAELRSFWGEHAERAAHLLEQAIERAPESREILGAFAVASAQAWIRAEHADLVPRARIAVARALAAGVPEAHLAAGLLRVNEGDVEAGAAALAQAVLRAPMSAPAHESVARLLVEIDLVPQGVAHFETASGLDPGRVNTIAMDLARVEGLAGNDAAAARRAARLLADPDPHVAELGAMTASRLATWRGDREGALAAVRALGARVDERAGMYGFLARAIAGDPFDRVRWSALIERLCVDGPRRMMLARLQRATEIALLVGEPAAAIEALTRTLAFGMIDLVWFDRCALLAPVWASPEGVAFRKQLAARAAAVRDAFAPVAAGSSRDAPTAR